jgi:iron-sulfur cluster repair protein YtfE (RIC family)
MSTHKSFSEYVERVVADHALLLKYMENVDKLSANGSAKAKWDAVDGIKKFIGTQLVSHFSAEERYVFPVLVEADPTPRVKRLVAELSAEHKSMLKEVARLNKLLAAKDGGSHHGGVQAKEELEEGLLNLLHALQKHALKENELFPSLL